MKGKARIVDLVFIAGNSAGARRPFTDLNRHAMASAETTDMGPWAIPPLLQALSKGPR
jgi:hypothetical protein